MSTAKKFSSKDKKIKGKSKDTSTLHTTAFKSKNLTADKKSKSK